ncbi:putative ribonuclease H protein [Camellia lanceoleosa]|uniref:Ribonuclease H protein n=1 Tax=Camellia lanceoleosa TaxID=1840588 RepID=A0ACC0HUG5_9ERIC|nr:putative ribonuclease H protein [Camellia lanceoleosa]
MEDSLVWHHSHRGIYDVKSGYRVAVEAKQSAALSGASSSLLLPKDFWKVIWSTPVPPKIRNFWWRVCCNKLASKENLFRRRCSDSQQCPICNASVESIEHLLFRCDWTRAVWFACDLGLRSEVGLCPSAKIWTLSLMEMCSNVKDRKEIVGKAAVVCWFIWKARNDWVFSQSPVNPQAVVGM